MKKVQNKIKSNVNNNVQYQILSKLGSGLTAQVFSANSPSHGKVSIKIIQQSFVKSQIGSQLIENQIKVLKVLNHKNILKFIEKIQKNDKIYIVTSLCEGGTLENYIRKHKKLKQETAIKLLSSVVQGCIYLKEKHIIHRDIKPCNIFLKQSEPILADFGFAVFESDKKLLNINAGSPLYMPHESLTKKKFSEKSDVFALGVCLFQMLTGRTPWNANSQKELIQLIRYSPKMPSQISSNVSKLILKCLAKEPTDRPSFEGILEQINKIKKIVQQKQQKSILKLNTTIDNIVKQEIKSKRCISSTMNCNKNKIKQVPSMKNLKSHKQINNKNKNQKQNCINKNKQKEQASKRITRSITLQPKIIEKQNKKLNDFELQAIKLQKIEQCQDDFLTKLNPNQFTFLPVSLIHKFKFILSHYNKILGNKQKQQIITFEDKDTLISEIKQCKTEEQLCKCIQSFVRRLFRLTKNYKQYKSCLTNLQPLYKRVTNFVL